MSEDRSNRNDLSDGALASNAPDHDALDEVLGTISSAYACCSRAGGCVDFPALAADVRAVAALSAPPTDPEARREEIEALLLEAHWLTPMFDGATSYMGIRWNPGGQYADNVYALCTLCAKPEAECVARLAIAAPARLSGEGGQT